MKMLRPRRARAAAWLLLAAALLVPGLAQADSEAHATIDNAIYDAKENLLTVAIDVVDAKGAPVENLTADDFSIKASGKDLKFLEPPTVQTAEKAQEPVAVLILLNASRGYQIQEGEAHSTYQQAKEGAAQFITRLKGNDMVAVIRYRESVPQEVICSFASNFDQAKEQVLNDTLPTADLNPETNQGQKERETSLLPEFQSALKKALGYFNENLGTNAKLASTRRRFLVVISDAKDRETRKDKLQPKLKKMVEGQIDENKIRIYAIGYSPDDEQYLSLLQEVANVSGGAYTYVSNKDGLGTIPSVFDNVANRIKKQYIITARLAELPDGGEVIKGKDEAKHIISVKAKLKGDAEAEAVFTDVVLPKPSLPWTKYLKWAGMALGGLLGIGLIVLLIIFLVRRKGSAPAAEERQTYDGPSRGRLAVLQGPLAGENFPLIDDVTTIGSMKGNTIVISDGSVSRRHAAIKIDQMRYEVADMNSTNGILVNGQRVHKVFLKDGDQIQIGSTVLQFNLK